jgi:hypothetical protein
MKLAILKVFEGLYDDSINELEQVYPSITAPSPLATFLRYLLLIPLVLVCFFSVPYHSHLTPLLPFGTVTLILLYLSPLALGLTLFPSTSVPLRKLTHSLCSFLFFPSLY